MSVLANPKLIEKLLGKRLEEVMAEEAEEVAATRAALRKRVLELDGTLLGDIRACEKRLGETEKKEEALKLELEAANKETIRASYELSDARDEYFRQRDRLWAELAQIPAPEMVAFRDEVERRIGNSHLHSAMWPNPKQCMQTGMHFMLSNHATLSDYVQALLASKSNIDVAIMNGLAGEEAAKFIADTRATWPKVQVGVKEFVAPVW